MADGAVIRHDMVRAFASAFTEWDRRYRENPSAFATEWLLTHGTAATYGEAAAAYFAARLDELAAGHPWGTINADAVPR